MSGADIRARQSSRPIHWLWVVPFLAYALVVNGAVPGVLTPTLGQAVWLTGFAESFAHAGLRSVFAHDIGIPAPAAIALGLPLALVAAIFLLVGLAPPDAYSAACMVWLTVAFGGAYAFGRQAGAGSMAAPIGAAIWLTFPVVWMHASYSAVSIGIALLPAYVHLTVRVAARPSLRTVEVLLFPVAAVVAAFMDGYSFVMFASAALAVLAKTALLDRRFGDAVRATAIVSASILIAFLLYNSFSPSAEFRYEIDFFRGWGADLSFLIAPTAGILWLPDALGWSVQRRETTYFGDASVFWTTFLIVPLVVAAALTPTRYGSGKAKVCFLAIGFVSLYLALGPSFKYNALRPDGMSPFMPAELALGPTGTAFLWENVPGLYNMRAVYRWVALAIFGFWAVMMVATSDRRMPRRAAFALLLAVAILNVPGPLSLLGRYSSDRAQFLEMEADLERTLAPHLRQGETMAFLPTSNDFLINFLAPRFGIRTYNIGGDKNAAIAERSWPNTILHTEAARTPEAFAEAVLDLLRKDADAVAFPYIHLLWGAHVWPAPLSQLETATPNVVYMSEHPAFDVANTEYFAIVRIAEDVDPPDSHAEFMQMYCRGPNRVRALADRKISLAEAANLCGNGWSGVEPWGRWTEGSSADFSFSFDAEPVERALEIDARVFTTEGLSEQRVLVTVNGLPEPVWLLGTSTGRVTKRIPVPAGATDLLVEFDLPDARSPMSFGTSEDARVLGLGVEAVCLVDIGETCL